MYGQNYNDQGFGVQQMRQGNNNNDGKLKFKFNIGIEEIRELIDLVNRKPFEENMTLVSFDE